MYREEAQLSGSGQAPQTADLTMSPFSLALAPQNPGLGCTHPRALKSLSIGGEPLLVIESSDAAISFPLPETTHFKVKRKKELEGKTTV